MNALPDAYVRPTPTRCLGVVFPPLRRYYDILPRVSDSSGENLTPACRIGDDIIFNVVFSMEASPWSFVYLNSIPKRSLFMWFLCGRI